MKKHELITGYESDFDNELRKWLANHEYVTIEHIKFSTIILQNGGNPYFSALIIYSE